MWYAGSFAFFCGGEATWGMQSAAYTTYYNIRATPRITYVPKIYNGPLSNFLLLQVSLDLDPDPDLTP